jgi:uncharacterized protein DUF4407
VTDHGYRRRGPAAALRTLTGVDEGLLDTVATERPRYTAMGGVVLGTALMAMFSLTVALLCVFDGFQASILLFVPIWGAFILFLDQWLMSSAAVARGGARLRKLAPRLLLSIIFGAVIAEPLLLGVFHSAVDQRVRDDRIAAAGQFDADLKYCNPLPGKPAPAPPDSGKRTPDCGDKRITVPTDAPAIQKQIDGVNSDIKTLRATTGADDKEFERLNEMARKECNGTRSAETTGLVGQGPNCKRLRTEADRYHTDHHMKQNNDTLTGYQKRVGDLTRQLGDAQAAEGSKINAEIRRRVDDYKGNQRSIGLLERLGALGELVDGDRHMHTAQWALRLFFIVVDALPVLLKFFTGFTPYDQVVAERVAAQRRVQRVISETERRRGVIQEQLARLQMNAEHAAAVGKVEFDARMRNVDVEVLREDLTDARAAYLLGDTPTMPLSVPPGGGHRFDGAGEGGPR